MIVDFSGRSASRGVDSCRVHDGFVEHNQDVAAAAATVADDVRSALLGDLQGEVAGTFPVGTTSGFVIYRPVDHGVPGVVIGQRARGHGSAGMCLIQERPSGAVEACVPDAEGERSMVR